MSDRLLPTQAKGPYMRTHRLDTGGSSDIPEKATMAPRNGEAFFTQLHVGKTRIEQMRELDFTGILLFVSGCVSFLIGLS